ncbi:39S ribosomal protein L53 [Cricetulus griseus]|nr:39S ribosomal protein L53 [Cricetulus griseus]
MASALARVGLKPVKLVRVQFCPFEKNVESTSYKGTNQSLYYLSQKEAEGRNGYKELITTFDYQPILARKISYLNAIKNILP